MAKKSKINVSSPIFYIVLGALLFIFKSQMLNWAITIAGICCLAIGIVDLIKGRVGSGIFNIALGAIILIVGLTILNVVLLVLGILIAAKGVADLISILKNKKRNALSVIFAALTIAIGIALAFGKLLGDLIAVIGILLVIDGILGLLGARK